MKSWNFSINNELSLAEGVITPKEREIKVKMSKVALSAFDVSCFLDRENKKIAVPAHAAIARMTEDNDELGLKLGSRVVISPFVKEEEHGETVVHTLGVDRNGFMQDFVCVPVENVFSLPDGIGDEEAVFTEYIAMGNKVFASLDCDEGDYVVVMGGGTLGLVLCQLALYYQMVPILVDLDEDKLALAKSWDVSYTLNPTYDNLERRVEEITGGRMSEVAVFTAEGTGLNGALRLVKDGGEVVIAGYPSPAKHRIDTNIILNKQLRIKGVCNGDGEISSAINLLANQIVQTNGIINARADFEKASQIIDECIKYPLKYSTVLFSID